jgi:COMPASS component SWD3
MSATLSSTIRIYSLNTGKVLKTLRAGEYISERYPCPAVVFAGHARAAANGHGDEAMEVEADEGGAGSRAVSVSAAAKGRPAWVIAGSENGKAVIWDLQDRRVICVLDGHVSPVVAVAVSPDGRTVATGSLEPDRTVRLWRT